MKFDLSVNRTGKRPMKRAAVRELLARYRKQGQDLVYGLGQPGRYCAIGQFAPEAAKFHNIPKKRVTTWDCRQVTRALFGGHEEDWNWLWKINDKLASAGYKVADLEVAYEAYLKNPNRFDVWKWVETHPK